MNGMTVVRIIGIVLVCVGIHLGLGSLMGLVIFGCGLGCLFLP